MIKYSLSFILILSFLLPSIAQNKLTIAVNALENDEDLKYATLGFCAIDINKNQIVAKTNENRALAPASSMKVVATGSALGILGKDYRFETYIQHDGIISGNVLKGNLYIKGTGDPCLGSPVMQGPPTVEKLMAEFVAAIEKAGIKKIEGRIVGDGTYFDDAAIVPTWQWGDIGNHYGSGVSGLNIHDNFYYLTFQQNSSFGATPKIKEIKPKIPGLDFTNYVTNAGRRTGDNAYVYLAPYDTDVVIRGTIPSGSGDFQIKGAMPDPPLFAAYELHRRLKNKGITVARQPTSQRALKSKAERKTIYTHYSPKLIEIAKHTNEESRNMYCEAMIKAIGVKKSNIGRRIQGIGAIMDFWRARGVDMDGFFMQDGSGLSARNGVTAKTMAEIMRKLQMDKNTFSDFYNLLAIAGQSGTLKNIGRGTAADGNIHAKSGSMNRIRSYTGYVTTQKGSLLSFSMIVNNYTCTGRAMRKKFEQLMVIMAGLDDI